MLVALEKEPVLPARAAQRAASSHEITRDDALKARLMSSRSLARSADAYISPDVKRPPIEANNE